MGLVVFRFVECLRRLVCIVVEKEKMIWMWRLQAMENLESFELEERP